MAGRSVAWSVCVVLGMCSGEVGSGGLDWCYKGEAARWIFHRHIET
jgi:hypothetical protein